LYSGFTGRVFGFFVRVSGNIFRALTPYFPGKFLFPLFFPQESI